MNELKFKKLSESAFTPVRAHENDAGIDVFAVNDFIVEGEKSIVVPIDISFECPKGFFLLVQTKSGIGTKRFISTSAGATVIDENYRGNCHVQLINFGKQDQLFKRGDKIAQLLLLPVSYAKLVEADELSDTDRGTGGFGSTGTKA